MNDVYWEKVMNGTMKKQNIVKMNLTNKDMPLNTLFDKDHVHLRDLIAMFELEEREALQNKIVTNKSKFQFWNSWA